MTIECQKSSFPKISLLHVQVVSAQPQVHLVASNPFAALMAAAVQQEQQDQEVPVGGDPRSFEESQAADLLAGQEQDSHTVLDDQV